MSTNSASAVRIYRLNKWNEFIWHALQRKWMPQNFTMIKSNVAFRSKRQTSWAYGTYAMFWDLSRSKDLINTTPVQVRNRLDSHVYTFRDNRSRIILATDITRFLNSDINNSSLSLRKAGENLSGPVALRTLRFISRITYISDGGLTPTCFDSLASVSGRATVTVEQLNCTPYQKRGSVERSNRRT